jgi:hypothetical protein
LHRVAGIKYTALRYTEAKKVAKNMRLWAKGWGNALDQLVAVASTLGSAELT